MDVSGEQQIDLDHNIWKKRLGPDGNPLAVEKEAVGDAVSHALNASDSCGSCYGAETPAQPCCQTCEEVREAYRLKGWGFANPDNIQQCIVEQWSKRIEEQRHEGCEVYGHLLVNKVAGNFHFAPGKSYTQASMHIHDTLAFSRSGSFNLTHEIVRLSFGDEYPGQANPLDGVEKRPPETAMFQYFIKIVPTVYESLAGAAIATNQFSVTEHYRPLASGQSHGLPGVFFMYDLSPIMIRLRERKRSLASFLTGVCAIVGGVFTVAGLVDSFIYHGMRSLRLKRHLGKAS
jgi:hypothetical protein